MRASVCLLVLPASSASATEYANGISDQSMTQWDHGFGGYFTDFFKETWLPAGHIKYARFAIGWNETSGGTDPEYESWCSNAAGMGLTLDLSITTYQARTPEETIPRPSVAEYKTALKTLLEQCPSARIVETWSEPDNGERKKKETDKQYIARESAGRRRIIARERRTSHNG
jgi:hypothetical protein